MENKNNLFSLEKKTSLNKKETIFADLHIHSRFSRACSKDLNIPNLVKWARIKGLDLLGTGDFTHPNWIEELRALKEEDGILWWNPSSESENSEASKSADKPEIKKFPFILSSEISLIYTDNGSGRKVHLVYLAPNLEAADKINKYLDGKGRRDYDGRPIFKISCRDFAADMEKIDDRIEIIPAHCLLPDSWIHTNKGVKRIKDMKISNKVLTHSGVFRKVKEVLNRDYNGKVYHIIPWYFREGLITTPEHPFYIIKSYKNCKSTKGLCKPLCSQVKNCKRKYFKDYSPKWRIAEDIEIGDFLVYPRMNKQKDFSKIDLCKYVGNYKNMDKNFIISKNARNHTGKINRFINIDEKFCRLIGYFLSEGFLMTDKGIGFSFNSKEKNYIDEVIFAIRESFGFNITKIDNRRENQSDLIFSSKILNSFFRNFYSENIKRANTKILPEEFILLSKQKIAEIFRGWWRGDTGYTVSRQLANQMKMICLKLGIIPSISIDSMEFHKNRGNHFIEGREIIAKNDLIIFSNLSFFEENYGMLKENCFKKFINKINRKHGWIDENYVYLPIKKIEIKNYKGEVYNLEVEKDNSYVSEFACVHNCWTPYFGIFGSKSGFDSLEEAFKDKLKNIHVIETGISSDPAMNWTIKDLENIGIVSFSDAHSYWPWRLGREATIFHLPENIKLSYDLILKQIREKTFKSTIEADPAYGKYHFDGHMNCNFSCSPKETKKLNGICPKCKKPLTIGVDNRVEELAEKGKAEHKYKKEYYKILPLHELISLALGIGINSKGCWKIYNELISNFENEFNILLNISKENLAKVLKNELLIDLIIKNREEKIKIIPGYDGQYGKAILSEKQNKLF